MPGVLEEVKKRLDLWDTFPGLRAAVWNIRSANNKLGLLSHLFADENLDFMIVLETWQIPSVRGKLDAFSAAFKEHLLGEDLSTNLICKPRGGSKKGGGIALVTKSTIKVSSYKLSFPAPKSFEYLCCKIKTAKQFLLICIYRCPSVSLANFLLEFTNLLVSLSSLSLEAMIVGDFNIKVNLVDDFYTARFITLISEYNMSIISPPSPSHQLGNTLDFMVVPDSFNSSISPMIADDTVSGSDHFPCFFAVNSVPLAQTRALLHPALCRSVASVEPELVSRTLRLKLSPLLTADISNFSDYLSQYREGVTDVLDNLAPLQPKRILNTHARPPWMDQHYAKQRALRKRLQRRGDKAAYNAQKRLCQYLAKSKRISSNKLMVEEAVATNDQRQVFKAVNKLLDRSKSNQVLPDHGIAVLWN